MTTLTYGHSKFGPRRTVRPLHEDLRWNRLRSTLFGLLTLGFLGGTFLLDLTTAQGYASWASYPAAVVSALLWKGRPAVLGAACAGTMLTIFGAMFSPQDLMLPSLTNRLFGLASITLVTWLCLYVDQDETQLQRAVQYFEAEDERVHLFLQGAKHAAVILLDANAHVAGWYGQAEQITGYRANEILGRSVSCLFPDEDNRSDRLSRLLAQVRREGRVHEDGWCPRRDGSELAVSRTIDVLTPAPGRLAGFAMVLREPMMPDSHP